MSDEKEINVTLSADVKSLLQGMKEAQEHTETAVSGMKGDLGSAIESFEKFGASALAIGVVGVAFEALRESMDFVKESIEETNELSKSFKDLAYQTGISHQELNVLATAQALEGGSIRELEGWMKGATKAIKANADMLVENGIAASKAELMAMPFTEYLKKVMEAAEGIQDPIRRGIFLQEALGRAGMEAAPQIREMLEQLEGAPEILAHYGRAIGQDNVAEMERFEHATGKVTIAARGLKQTLAETFGDNLVVAKERWAEFVSNWADGVHQIFGDSVNIAARKEIEKLKAEIEKGNAELKALGGTPVGGAESHEEKKAEKHIKTKEEIEEEKKAAEERRAMRKAADDDIIRSAAFATQEQIKDDKELVASGQMTFAELVADMKAAYKVQLDTSMKALEDEKLLAAGKPAEMQAVLNKQKELTQKYYADIHELERQAAENGRKEKEKADAEAEKARKQNLELAKLTAQDEINLLRFIMDEKEQALDEELAFGRINEAQWVAMKKAGITQELRAQLDALDQEQKAAKDDLVHWQKIQNQKDALNRKAYADLNRLDTEATTKAKSRWDSFFGSMTGGFNNVITGLVKGTMTWGQAFNQALDQGLSGLISFFVNWGEQEAIKWATSLAMGKAGRSTEIVGAASAYAVNAMGSVAAIPFYGWAMAPEVGATAFAEGMSFLPSAAGGWERVPQDTLAQIHKNEMILPPHIAEPVRQMAERGGGGQPIQITIQALDGQDVHRVLTKHQDSLFRVMREGGKNRRL